MAHPFSWLPPDMAAPLFRILLVMAISMSVFLTWLGRPLTQSGAGIVAFELAGTQARARSILRQWGEQGRLLAMLNLGLDYLFLVIYPACLALGCMLVEVKLAPLLPGIPPIGAWIAWAQVGAGLLDGVENYALIRLLLGSQGRSLPRVARICALSKFALIVLGLLYLALGALLWLL